MKISFATILVLFSLFSGAQNVNWAFNIGGTGTEAGIKVICDADGNVLNGGDFESRTDFDPGPDSTIGVPATNSSHLYITKSDSAGNFIWLITLRNDASSYLGGIVTDADNNIYVTGTFGGASVDFDPGPNSFLLGTSSGQDIFVAKYDALGHFVWAKKMTSTGSDGINAMTIDANANIYFTGYFEGNFSPFTGHTFISSWWDYFVAKFDSSGNYVWTNVAGGASQDIGYGLAVDNSGNTYTIGGFNDAIDFDPGPGVYDMNDSMNTGGTFFAKYDPAGNLIWAKMIGAPGVLGHVYAKNMEINSTGNLVVTGSFRGTSADFEPGPNIISLSADQTTCDCFIAQYDTSGHCNWVKKIDYSRDQSIKALSIDNSQNIYLTGLLDSLNTDFDPGPGVAILPYHGATDIYVVSYDEQGNYRFGTTFGSPYFEHAFDIFAASDGSIYITGDMSNTLTFNTPSGIDTLTSHNYSDILLFKCTDLALGIQQIGATTEDVQIYPSPSTGIINFNHPDAIEIIIYDGSGKKLLIRKSNSCIDVSTLTSGLYFADIKLKNGTHVVRKFVKE